MKKAIVKTEKAPAAVGPYSQGAKAGNLVFVSGQLALDATTGKFVEGGYAEQARQSLNNVQAILEAGGSSLEKVVKATVFLTDMSKFGEVNKVYAEFFKEDCPARACVEVAALPLGGLVEVEVIAIAE